MNEKVETHLLSAVEATIDRHCMLNSGDTVVVGVSGGPDSVALLHCLLALRSRWSLELIVAHLNHQLRGTAAAQDAVFVRKMAAHLDLPCVVDSKDVKAYRAKHRLSIQEAARKLRYAFYEETAARLCATKIALGHQQDDNAESVLMHLMRGTGPRGLAGIPPVRRGRIIRPLLEVSRSEILAFLKCRGLEYVQDSSNFDNKYLRNRIRHELLPLLERDFKVKPSHTLTRLAAIVRDEEDFWDQVVSQTFDDLTTRVDSNRIEFSVAQARGVHPALLRRVIRHAVERLRGDLKRLNHGHVEAAARLMTGISPYGWLDLPLRTAVCRDGDTVIVSWTRQEATPRFEHLLEAPGVTVIPEIGMTLRLHELAAGSLPAQLKDLPQDKAFLDLDTLEFPLTVRNTRPGDRFRPLGMAGSQKLQDFFINHKVPRRQRRRCPVVTSRDRIVWVAGHRIDDSVKITDTTKRVLVAELIPEGIKKN
ncbi:MAG: tRNA lysidine(34) synthetase TilS [Deltaproteobacteria bacterium]|nr:tRNA lysidine(34) synthetase TilS [Deltaproteobacteria bacterium]